MEIVKYNIFFTKTAKTATETIRRHLKIYATDNNLIINDRNYQSFFNSNKFNINTNHIFSTKEYLNHFYSSIDTNLPILKITSVRKPLERLYSHYCYGNKHFKNGMDFNEWYIKSTKRKITDGWNVPHWGDKSNNYMFDYMNLDSVDEVHTKYDFVFIKERFSNSLEKFGKILEYDFKEIEKLNTNPKVNKDYIFDIETKNLFEENNQNDINLYNTCYQKYTD